MSHEIAFGDGLLAAAAGKRTRAKNQFEKADELNPGNSDVALWLAWTADSPKQALDVLSNAVKRSPENELLWAFRSVTQQLAEFESGRDYRDFFGELIDGPTKAAYEETSDTATSEFDSSLVVKRDAKEIESPRDELKSDAAHDDLKIPDATEQPDGSSLKSRNVEQTTDPVIQAEADTNDYYLSSVTEDNGLDESKTNAMPIERSEIERSIDEPIDSGTTDESDDSPCPTMVSDFDQVQPSPYSLFNAASDENDSEAADQNSDGSDDNDLEQSAESVIDQVAEIQGAVDRTLSSRDATYGQTNSSETQIEPEAPSVRRPKLDSLSADFGNAPDFDADTIEPSAGGTILAVDDSKTVLKLVSMTLSSSGYEVRTAENGIEAMKMLVNFTPSLILLDINMPRMDGYQLCKFIKRHGTMKTIPVVMLSGKDGIFDKFRGTLAGCDDYITKPFESADLLRHVEKYLGANESN